MEEIGLKQMWSKFVWGGGEGGGAEGLTELLLLCQFLICIKSVVI